MTAGAPGVALVNGAGGGIGSAIAMAFADRGLSLGLVDRSAESIRALAGRLPAKAKYTTGCFDSRDGPSVESFRRGSGTRAWTYRGDGELHRRFPA